MHALASVRPALGVALALAACLSGCEVDANYDPPVTRHTQPLAARCTAQVTGVGEVDIETVYLPAVIACENGAAADEALKAQAVAARTYLYFKLETSGAIGDGTGDQVFTCNRPPQARHLAAVEATAGEVLMHDGIVLAAFYVAGAIPQPPVCRPQAGDRDPTGTEQWVTYNEGLRGGAVNPSPLGHPANPRNRGCKSQNGAHCLATAGRGYRDILAVYYGADLVFERAQGACVSPPDPPDAGPPADQGPPPVDAAEPPPEDCDAVLTGDTPLVVDDGSACFERACETGDWWTAHAVGEGGGCLTTGTIDRDTPDCWGRWRFEVATPGEYAVDVHLPDPGLPLSAAARYTVRHGGRVDEVRLDQAARGGWVSLGRFDFTAGEVGEIALLDNSGEPYREGGPRLVYDAIRVRAAAAVIDDLGPAPDAGRPDAGVGGDAGAPADQGPPAPDAGRPQAQIDAAPPGRDGGPAGTRRLVQTGGCRTSGGPAAPLGVFALLVGGLIRRRRAAPRPARRPAPR